MIGLTSYQRNFLTAIFEQSIPGNITTYLNFNATVQLAEFLSRGYVVNNDDTFEITDAGRNALGLPAAERPAPPPVGVASAALSDTALNTISFLREGRWCAAGAINPESLAELWPNYLEKEYEFGNPYYRLNKNGMAIVDSWSVQPADHGNAPVAAVSDGDDDAYTYEQERQRDIDDSKPAESPIARLMEAIGTRVVNMPTVADMRQKPAPQPAADVTAQRVRLSACPECGSERYDGTECPSCHFYPAHLFSRTDDSYGRVDKPKFVRADKLKVGWRVKSNPSEFEVEGTVAIKSKPDRFSAHLVIQNAKGLHEIDCPADELWIVLEG